MPVSTIRAILAQYQYHKGLDIPLPNCFIFSQCFKVGINHYLTSSLNLTLGFHTPYYKKHKTDHLLNGRFHYQLIATQVTRYRWHFNASAHPTIRLQCQPIPPTLQMSYKSLVNTSTRGDMIHSHMTIVNLSKPCSSYFFLTTLRRPRSITLYDEWFNTLDFY